MAPAKRLHPPLGIATLAVLALSLALASRAQAYQSWQRDQFIILGDIPNTDNGLQYSSLNNAWFNLVINGVPTRDAAIQHELYLRQQLLAYPRTWKLHGIVAYESSPHNACIIRANDDCTASNAMKNFLCGVPDPDGPDHHTCEPGHHFGIDDVIRGMYIWDEPTGSCNGCNSDCFHHVEKSAKVVEQDLPTNCGGDKFAFVNLLSLNAIANPGNPPLQPPAYAPCIVGGTEEAKWPSNFRCYLKHYLDIYNTQTEPAPVLSVDSYPFEVGDPNISPDWFGLWSHYFEALRIQSEMAAEYSRPDKRIPVWRYVQAGRRLTAPEGTLLKQYPTHDQIRWQVYAAIGYGAKGIGYFPAGPTSHAGNHYEGGLFKFNSASIPSERFSFISGLNSELRRLSGTLGKLDRVVTYHQSPIDPNGREQFIGDFLLGNTNRVYNIVSNITGSGAPHAMVTHFKHQTTGEDYLFVFNKDRAFNDNTVPPGPKTFTINLTNSATAIYEISKTQEDPQNPPGGLAVPVPGATATQFTFQLQPGEGKLFKLDDDIFEYIPNVNAIKEAGGRTYYAHAQGIVMVDYSTGWRTYVAEGSEPPFSCIDLAVDAGAVFAVFQGATGAIPPNGGPVGFVANYDLDLVRGNWTWSNNSYGLPSAVALSSNRIFVGHKGWNTGNVYVFDRNSFANIPMTTAIGLRVNDIEFQQGAGSYAWFVVAHQSGVKRFLPTAGFPNDYSWTGQSPIVDVETTPSYVFAAKDNGSSLGRIDRLSYTLSPNSYWLGENWNQPRVVDLALNPDGTMIMAATIKNAVYKFFRLTTFPAPEGNPYSTISIPRCTHLDAGGFALLATGLGVSKRNSGGAIQATQPPVTDDGPDVSSTPREITVECFPNPIALGSKVRLTLPAAGIVRVRVIDLLGREVAVLKNGLMNAGIHEMKWSPPTGRPGVYYVALDTDQGRVVRKAVVLQ